MTERFVVPEKLLMNGGYIHPSDLPAIVRAEVVTALREAFGQNWHDNGEGLPSRMVDYLTARYGSAPDNERNPSPDNDSREALRAPTFTREAEAYLLAAAQISAGLTVNLHILPKAANAYLASQDGR